MAGAARHPQMDGTFAPTEKNLETLAREGEPEATRKVFGQPRGYSIPQKEEDFMRIMRQMGKAAPTSALFLALALLLLAGCGSNATGSSTTAVTSATATACAQATRPATSFRTAVGVLKSISGQTLILTNTQGTDVTVTYTSSTTFTQEVKIAASALKEGSSVRVAVTSSGSTYTAVSVLVSTGTGTGNGGFGGHCRLGQTRPGARP